MRDDLQDGLRDDLRAVMLLIREVSQAMNAEIADHVDPVLGSNGVVTLLASLSLNGPQRPNQLVDQVGLSAAGLSSLVRRVEEAGYVERTSGVLAYDRRSVMITLTLKGHRFISLLTEIAFRNFLHFAPQMKELLISLEHVLGEATSPSQTPPAGRKSSVILLLALAQVGTAITEAARIPDPSGVLLDTTSTLTLLAIQEAGPCRPGYLSDRLHVTSGGVTRLADRLASAGLVSRMYGSIDSDRRGTLLELTPAGQGTADQALVNVAPHARPLYATLHEICLVLGIIDD